MATEISDGLRDQINTLRGQGYKIKKNYAYDTKNQCTGFRALKDFVSLRANKGYTPYHVLSRNANGGYIGRGKFTNFNDALTTANKIVAEEAEPEIPTWDRGGLPEPYEFISDKIYYKISKGKHYVALDYQVLPCHIEVHGIVAIMPDCTIQPSNDPSDNPWFILRISGTRGKIDIITDGDKWYPVRGTTHNRYKINLEFGRHDDKLKLMGFRDHQHINIAIRHYANHVLHQ